MITRISVRKWDKALAPNANHHSHSSALGLAAKFVWTL